MSDRIQEINGQIDDKYHQYKTLYAELTVITNDIKSLEEERNTLIDNDGRRFLFKKPAIELRDFVTYVKREKWMSMEYEGFDGNVRSDITEDAMVVSVFCFQPNYSAPARIIVVFDGYLNKDEYDVFRQKHSIVSEYYLKGDSDAAE